MAEDSGEKKTERADSEESSSTKDQQQIVNDKNQEEREKLALEKDEVQEGPLPTSESTSEDDEKIPAPTEEKYDERNTDALTLIGDLKKGGRYRGVISAIRDLRSSMDQKIHTRLWKISEKRVDDADDALKDFESESSEEFEDLRGYLEQARKALKENDYDSVDSFLDTFGRTKEIYEKRVFSVKYREEIEKARRELTFLIKAGIEVPAIERRIISMEKELYACQFDKIKRSLDEVVKRIREAKTLRAKEAAKNNFNEVKITFDRLNSLGMDLIDEKKFFREAMLAIKGKHYLEGCILLNKTKGLLKKTDEQLLLESLSRQLEEHNNLFLIIEKQEYFSERYRDSIRGALEDLQEKIQDKRVTEATDEMKVFQNIMLELKDKMEKYEQMVSLLKEISYLIERGEEYGADILKEREMLEDGKKQLEMDNLEEADTFLIRAKNLLAEKLEQTQREKAEKLLIEAKIAIDENRGIIEDISGINLHMLNANTYFAQRKYEHSIKTVTRIIGSIKEMKDKFKRNEIQKLFNETENAINENKERGIKVFESEALYYKAKFFFEKNDFEQGSKYARSSLDCALRDRNEIEKKKARTPLTEARNSMKEAIKIGAATGGIVGILESAQNYFDNGKYSKAEEWANLAQTEIRGVIDKKLLEIIQERKEGIETLLEQVWELEVETDEEKELLLSVEEMKEADQYAEAIELLKKIEASVQKHINKGIFKSYEQRIDRIEKEYISFQEDWGKSFTDLGQFIEMARSALNDESHDLLESHLKEFQKGRERYHNILLSNRYTEKVSNLEPDLKRFKKLGIDISGTDELVAEMSRNISNFDFNNAETTLDELLGFIDNVRTQQGKRLAGENFKKTKELFLEMKEQDIEMEGAKDLIKRAMERINRSEYIEAIEFTLDAKKALYEARDRHHRDMTATLLEDIKKIKVEGRDLNIDTTNIDELSKGARSSFEKRQFLEARELAELAKNEFREMMDSALFTIFNEKMSELVPLIEEANEIDSDIREEADALPALEEMKREKEYRKAIKKMELLKISVIKKRDIRLRKLNSRKIYVAVNALLALQEETGWELAELQACLDSGQESLERNDYEMIDNYLNEFFRLKTETKNQFLKGKYDQRLAEIRKDQDTLSELGIGLQRAEEFISAIRDDITAERFDTVAKLIKELSHNIEKAKKVEAKKLVNKYFSLSKGFFVQLKAAEIDLGEEKRSFKKAVQLTKDKDFIGACRLLMWTAERLKEQNKDYLHSKLTRLIGDGEEFFEKMAPHEYFAEEMKGDYRTSLDEIISLFTSKSYRNAMEKMNLLIDRTTELNLTMNGYDTALELSNKVDELIRTGTDIKADFENELADYQTAIELKNSAEFEESISRLKNIISSLEIIIEKRRAHEAKEALERAEMEFTKNLQIFDDVSTAEQRLTNVKALFQQKGYEEAAEAAGDLLNFIGAAMQKRMIDEIKQIIDESREIIDENKKLGIEIFESDALYYKARYHFERKEYELSREFSDTARDNALKYREEFRSIRASESINEAISILGRLKELKLDVRTAEENIVMGRERLDEKKFEEAAEIATLVKEELTKVHSQYKKEIVASEMDAFRGFAANLRGIEFFSEDYMDNIDRAIEEMEDLFEEDFLTDLQKKIEIFQDEMAQSKLKIQYRDEVEQLTNNIREQKGLTRELGIDTAKEDGQVEAVEALLEQHGFEEALPLLRSAESSLRNKIEIIRMKNAQRLFEEAVNIVEENRDIIDELSSVEEYFSNSTKFIEQKHYGEATDTLRELTGLIDVMKENKRAEEIGRELTDIEVLFNEIQKMGADVSLCRDMLEQAKASLERKNFGLAKKYKDEAKKTALGIKTEFHRRKAYSLLAQVQEGIRELFEHGIRTESLEINLPHIQRLLGEARFPEAMDRSKSVLENIDEAKKMHFRQKVINYLDSISEMTVKGIELDLDMSDIENDLASCERLSEEERFDEAIELARETRSKLNEMIEKRMDETVRNKLEELHSAMERATKLGIEINEEKEALHKIDEMREEGRIKDITDVILSKKVSIDSKVNRHLRNSSLHKINDVKNSFRSFQEETGSDYPDMRSYIELAKKAMEKLDYDAMEAFLKEFSRLKKRYEHDFWLDRYRTNIDEIENEIEEIRKAGFDAAPACELVVSLKEYVSIPDLPAAKETLTEIENILRDKIMIEVRKEAKDLIGSINEIMDELGETDLELEKQKAILTEVNELFESRDYLEAVKASRRLDENLKEAKGQFQKQQAMSILKTAEEMREEAEELGLDTEKTGKNIENCIENVEKIEPLRSIELARNITDELSRTIEMKLSLVVDEEHSLVKSKIMEGKGIDIDVEQEMENIASIEVLIGKRRYREAKKELQIITENVTGKIVSKRREILKAKRASFSKRIDVAASAVKSLEKETKRTYQDLHVFLEEAKKELESNNFDAVEGRLEDFFKSRDKHYDRVLSEKYARQISGMELEIARIQELGIDCTIGEDFISNAKEHLYRYEFDSVTELIHGLDEFIQDAKTVQAKSLAKELIKKGKDLIGKLKGIGKDVKEETRGLKNAIDCIRQGEFTKGCKLTSSANKMMKEAYKDHLKKNISTQLADFREFYKELDTNIYFSVEYKTRFKTMLEEIESALIEEDLEEAHREAETFKAGISEAKARMENFTKSEGSIKSVNVLCNEATVLNIDIGLEKNIMREVERLKGVGRLDDGYPLLSEAIESLENKIDLKRMEEANALFEKVLLNVEKNRTIIEDISGIEDRVGTAKGHLEQKEYGDFIEISKDILDMINELKEKNLLDELNPLLAGCRNMIEENVQLGINVFNSEKLLNKAAYYLDTKDFETSLKYARSANERATSDRIGFEKKNASAALAAAWEKISKSLEHGLEISDVEGIMAKAQGFFREEKYSEARSAAEEARSLVQKSWKRLNLEKVYALLKDLGELMEEGKELELDIRPFEEIRDRSKAYLGEERYKEAESGAQDGKERLLEIIDTKLSEVLRMKIIQLSSTIDRARDEDINVDDEADALVGIKNLKEGGKNRQGLETIRGIQTSLDGKLNEHERNLELDKIGQAERELKALEKETGGHFKELHSYLFSVKAAAEGEDLEALKANLGKFYQGKIECSRRFFSKNYSERSHELEEEANEIMKLGICVNDILELVNTIKKCISEEDFESAKLSLTVGRELLDDARTIRAADLARNFVDAMDGTVHEMEEKNMDTAYVKDSLEKIGELVKKEEYLAACGSIPEVEDRIAELKEYHMMDQFDESMGEIEKIIQTGKELGVEISDAEERAVSARGLWESKRLEEAIGMLSEAIADHKGRIETELSQRIRERLSSIDAKIDQARSQGIDVEKELKELSSIGDVEKEGKRREVLVILENVNNTLEEKMGIYLQDLNRKKLEVARGELGALKEETGDDLADLDALLAQAVESIVDGRFEDLEAAIEEINVFRKSHDEKSHRIQYEDRLVELYRELDTLKELGLDVTLIESKLDIVNNVLSTADLTDISVSITEISELIEISRTEDVKNRAKALFAETKKLYAKLARTDTKIDEGKKAFKEAVLALKKQDYENGIHLTVRAREMLLKAQDKDLMERSSLAMEDIRQMMDESREKGIDVSSVEEIISDIPELIENEDFENINELVEKAKETLSVTCDDHFIKNAMNILGELEEKIEEARGLDLNVSSVERTIDTIQDLIKGGKAEEAFNILGNGKKYLEEMIQGTKHKKEELETEKIAKVKRVEAEKIEAERLAEEKRVEAEKIEAERLAEEKRVEVEKIEAEGLAEEKRAEEEKIETERLVEEKRVEAEKIDAERLAKEKRVEAEKIETERLAEEKRVEAEKIETERLAEVKRAEAEKIDAERLVEEKRVDAEKIDAEKLGIEEPADEPIEEDEESQIRQLIDETEAIIKENGRMEIDIFRSEALLFKAKFAADNGNYDEAAALCNDSREQALESRRGLIEKEVPPEFQSKFNSLEELIKKAKKYNIDVAAEDRSMEEILHLKDEGKFSEGSEKIISVSNTVDRKIYENIHITKIEEIDNALRELEGLQEDTGKKYSELEKHLERATAALKEMDYEGVSASLEEFQKVREVERKRSYGRKYDEMISSVEKECADLKEIGIDVASVEDIIGLARDSASLSETAAVEGFIEKARTYLEELGTTQLKDLAKSLFAEAKQLLGQAVEAGVKVGDEKKNLQLAIKAFRGKDYIKVVKTASRSKENILSMLEKKKAKEEIESEKETEIDKISTALDELEGLIEEAEKSGLDTSQITDRIDIARSRLVDGKFDDAGEILEKAKDEITELMGERNRTVFQRKLKDMEEKAAIVKNNKMDVKEQEKAIAEIKALGREKKYDDALIRIEAARKIIEDTIEEKLYAPGDRRMKEALGTFREYSEETGEDLTELQDILIKAREALEENEFDRTDTLLGEFDDKKESHQKRFYTEHYQKRIEGIRSELVTIKEVGIDVGDCEDLLVLSKESMDRGEVGDRLKKMVTKAEKILGIIKMQDLFGKTRESLSETKELLNRVKEAGGETGENERTMKQAMKAMADKDFLKSIELSASIKDNMSKIIEELEERKEIDAKEGGKREAKEILEEAETILGEAKALELDVGLNTERIEIALSRFQEEKYEDAKELATVAKKEIEELIETKLSEKFEGEASILEETYGLEDLPEEESPSDAMVERTCPNCRKTVKGNWKRCVHCSALLEEPKEAAVRITCEICEGELETEGNGSICSECGAEYDGEGNLITTEESVDISDLLKHAKPEEEDDEEEEEEEPSRTVGDRVCELCGDLLVPSGNVLVCPLCGVEYGIDGEVVVTSGGSGPECELCGGRLEAKGRGMVCTECEAEYDSNGNFIALEDEDSYGVAIEKMISDLEKTPEEETKKAGSKEKKKIVKKTVKRTRVEKGKPEKEKIPAKSVAKKKAPLTKKTPVGKKAALKKKAPMEKKTDSKKKAAPKKKAIAKRAAKKKGKKGPTWEELKEAKKKKKTSGKKKKKKIEFDEPQVFSFLKKKK